MCDICGTFDGETWLIDQGPRPVADTHPHCLCSRIGYYKPPENHDIRETWVREQSPYDRGYTVEELNNLRRQWNKPELEYAN